MAIGNYYVENNNLFDRFNRQVTPRQVLGIDPWSYPGEAALPAQQPKVTIDALMQAKPKAAPLPFLKNPNGSYQHIDFSKQPTFQDQRELDEFLKATPDFAQDHPNANLDNISDIFKQNDSQFDQSLEYAVKNGEVPLKNVLNDYFESGEIMPTWLQDLWNEQRKHRRRAGGRPQQMYIPTMQEMIPTMQQVTPTLQESAPMRGVLNQLIELDRYQRGGQ